MTAVRLSFTTLFQAPSVQRQDYTPPKRHIAVHRVDVALIQAIAQHLGVTQTALYSELFDIALKNILSKHIFQGAVPFLVAFADQYSIAAQSGGLKPYWTPWYHAMCWQKNLSHEQHKNNIFFLRHLRDLAQSYVQDCQSLQDTLQQQPPSAYQASIKQFIQRLDNPQHPLMTLLNQGLTLDLADFLPLIQQAILRFKHCQQSFAQVLQHVEEHFAKDFSQLNESAKQADQIKSIIQTRLLKLNPQFADFLAADIWRLIHTPKPEYQLPPEAKAMAQQLVQQSLHIMQHNYTPGQIQFDIHVQHQLKVVTNDVETKNFRLTPELDTMLDTLSNATELPIQAIITTELSYALADFITTNQQFCSIVQSVFQTLCEADQAVSPNEHATTGKKKPLEHSPIYYQVMKVANILNMDCRYRIVPLNALSVLEERGFITLQPA